MNKLLFAGLLAGAAALTVACGDEEPVAVPSADTGGSADTRGTTDADPADAATDDTGLTDAAPTDTGGADTPAADTQQEDVEIDFTPDPECGGDWLVVVNGHVVTDEGADVAGAKSQLCVHLGSPDGNLVCLRPVDTDAEGSFEILVSNSTRCVGGGSMRVFAIDSTLATTYCHIDTATEGGTLDIAEDIVMFETDAVADLPPYDSGSAARSITFPGGFEIPEFVPDDLGFTFNEDVYANLGARRVDPASEGLCFVEEEVDGLFAFRVEANIDGAFDFRFPNDDGYEPGATVNLFVLGGLETKLEDGTAVAETAWENYGTATVSADGAWVEGSIPAFTWLGYALAE